MYIPDLYIPCLHAPKQRVEHYQGQVHRLENLLSYVRDLGIPHRSTTSESDTSSCANSVTVDMQHGSAPPQDARPAAFLYEATESVTRTLV